MPYRYPLEGFLLFLVSNLAKRPALRQNKNGNLYRKKLPVGIENFEEIRKEGFYYVDKTCLIRDLLNN